MKKIAFLSLFLLILSFSVLFLTKPVFAEIQNYTFTMSCLEQSSQGSEASSTNFNAQTNTYWNDYSSFRPGSSIRFTVLDTPIADTINDTLSYQWTSISGQALSQTKSLTIYKDFSVQSPNRELIKVGETKYVLTITNQENFETKDIVITITITDNNSILKMQTASTQIPSAVKLTSQDINFYANIPTTISNKISWYMKTPTSVSYFKVSEENNFCFVPNAYINKINGFGTYKIMVIGKTSQKTYYSQVFSINTEPESLNLAPGLGIYNIEFKKVKNTTTNIEAFEYTINDLNNFEPENLCWYVNGKKMCNGFTFKYEPTTMKEFKVVAKYNGVEVASRLDTPKPTDTYVLYIIIGAAIVVLITILVASIKISNKKRDVVW